MADIKRMHYFNHQFLVESDFTAEQQYHLAMRRRHNTALHDYGIGDGLAVTRTGDREVTVQPGMAIDRDGRELVFLDSRIVSLSDAAAFPAGATVHVTIAYHEEGSDPSTATGVTGDTRTMERPEVRASTTAPAGDGSVIRLAQFTLTTSGNVPGNVGDAFAEGRQLAGAMLAPASVATDKLADGAVDENKLSAGVRGKLVTHGDGHDHSGGDGAQIRHSSLSLDGGSNPHGTTAADVGALSSTGGTIVGNLHLYGGNVGLGTTPQPLSRLSLRSDDGPAGIAFATVATTSSDGSGNVTAVDVSAAGSGSGEKRGINCKLSGAGEKHAGYFSATSGAGSDFTQALHADASSEGSGPVMGLWAGLTGSGTGLKIGVVSEVRGGGQKQAATFVAESPTGSTELTQGINITAISQGSGVAQGLVVEAGGPAGTGPKQGIVSIARGTGHKQAGEFYAESDGGTADLTVGVKVLATTEGTGDTKGLLVDASGSGAGRKDGISCQVSGAGQKDAGRFHAYSDAGSADFTRALLGYAQNSGAGETVACHAYAVGEGSGRKQGVLSEVSGAGDKYAGQFYASSPAGSPAFTNALSAGAGSDGTGNVLALSVNSEGSGPGQKEGIVCTVSGSGHKYGGQFRAYSNSGTADGAEGLRAVASSNGTGGTLGFVVDAYGAGPGQKQGIVCTVDGSGNKYGGQFYSYNRNAGTADVTEGLRAAAVSEGTGDTVAFRTTAGGPGTGPKYGILAHAEGGGRKTAGVFSAIGGGGSADGTYGVRAEVVNDGTGEPIAIVASSGGAGAGRKCAVSAHTYGAGHKLAGAFRADGSTDSPDMTLALEALAQSKGSGSVSGIRAFATGEGSGGKEALSCSATGAGPKRSAYFAAETPIGQAEHTNGIYVIASNEGTGPAHAIYAYAVGAGTGEKIGIYSSASGGGTKWAGYFVGNVHVNGVLSKGSGTFLIDHPLDPENKTLRHSFVESPEDLCLYRGKVQLDATGKATVKMPTYFAALTREEDATVTLTAIGSKPFLTGYEWNRNFTAFIVYGEPSREVSYLVLADRDDPVIRQLRRPVEEKKGAGYFEKGQLLNPEAYGKPPKAPPHGAGTAHQTTARMDMGVPAFPDLPAPPTPTAPLAIPLSPIPTDPFPAPEEDHKRMEEAWVKNREEQRQRMESFQQEEEQRRRQLEEALAAAHRQPDQTPQHGDPIETDDEAPETPSAAPESASPRRKKSIADRKKR